MANYPVPTDIKEKEKVVGGLLTWVQFFWLLLGVAMGLVGVAFFYLLLDSKILAILSLLFSLAMTAPFSFVRIKGLTLFQFIKYSILLHRDSTKLPNRRN